MTGTDLCVNKCKQSRSYLNDLVIRKIKSDKNKPKAVAETDITF